MVRNFEKDCRKVSSVFRNTGIPGEKLFRSIPVTECFPWPLQTSLWQSTNTQELKLNMGKSEPSASVPDLELLLQLEGEAMVQHAGPSYL